MLITAILGFLAPLAAYTSYYFIFAILVAQVVSRIFVLPCLAASSDHDYRASVRELHIPPWTHIFQDGFQVASEAGSTQHHHQTKATLLLWYFRFTSFVFLGGTAGTVLTLPVSGILLNNYPWEVKTQQQFFGHQNIKRQQKKRPFVEILNLGFSNLPVFKVVFYATSVVSLVWYGFTFLALDFYWCVITS